MHEPRDSTAPPRFTIHARARSVGHAARGLRQLIARQHNAWIHLAATIAVTAAGLTLRLGPSDWRWLVGAIALVWMAEAINTAVEALCDHLHPGFDPVIGGVKDMAAGAGFEGVSPLRASFERVLASRQPDMLPGMKYEVARPDGTFEERWWSPVNTAVLDDDRKAEALIHNAKDVTMERQAAIALRESEERYRTLFETMGQGFALVELVRDTSGKAIDQRYLAFNPAIERLLNT